MQAIVTKYLRPTDFRGSRVKATAAAGSITVSWNHALDADGNHRAAVLALARKLDWTGIVAEGALPGGGNVYVFVRRSYLDDEVKRYSQVDYSMEIEPSNG